MQWETAAEAELAGDKRTTLDIYLNWTPVLALGLFLLVWLVRPERSPGGNPDSSPVGVEQAGFMWLDRPPQAPRKETSDRDRWLLRESALRTWRYFDEFSTEEHHWLIPDNVQGGRHQSRASHFSHKPRLSTQLASGGLRIRLPYRTGVRTADTSTLTTISKLQRHRGHLLNWYDTRSLVPLAPAVVSSVDSGNLVASLWTLQQGSHPIFSNGPCSRAS